MENAEFIKVKVSKTAQKMDNYYNRKPPFTIIIHSRFCFISYFLALLAFLAALFSLTYGV